MSDIVSIQIAGFNVRRRTLAITAAAAALALATAGCSSSTAPAGSSSTIATGSPTIQTVTLPAAPPASSPTAVHTAAAPSTQTSTTQPPVVHTSAAAPAAPLPSVSVTMQCVNSPCGSNKLQNYWHGYYVVTNAVGFGPNQPYVVTVTFVAQGTTNPQNYPAGQYDSGCSLYGVYGSCGVTDSSGQMPKLKWATNNGPSAPTDLPGTYTLTFHARVDNQIVTTAAQLVMQDIE